MSDLSVWWFVNILALMASGDRSVVALLGLAVLLRAESREDMSWRDRENVIYVFVFLY